MEVSKMELMYFLLGFIIGMLAVIAAKVATLERRR
jgi:hypothetical protein